MVSWALLQAGSHKATRCAPKPHVTHGSSGNIQQLMPEVTRRNRITPVCFPGATNHLTQRLNLDNRSIIVFVPIISLIPVVSKISSTGLQPFSTLASRSNCYQGTFTCETGCTSLSAIYMSLPMLAQEISSFGSAPDHAFLPP